MIFTNESIFKEIAAWKIAAEKDKDKLPAGAPDLQSVFGDFEQFCTEYFNEFFYKDFDNSKIDEEAINAVLFEYWEPLRYAAMQHFSPAYRKLFEKGYAAFSEYEKEINAEFEIKTDVPVILYFEKTGKAKRYPFRGIYLIGVPLADAFNGSWNSMAHELGHLIYWNARFNKQDEYIVPPPGENFFNESLINSVKDLTEHKQILLGQTFSAWTEEIFADIIGTRIAKENFAVSTWNRVITRAQKTSDLFITDGEHPFPYLIPYISSVVLGKPFDEDLWLNHYEKSAINAEGTRKRNAVKLEILRGCFETFVKGINDTVSTLKLEPWHPTGDESPFKALKNFVLRNDIDLKQSALSPQSLRKNIAANISTTDDQKYLQIDLGQKFRIALLKPRILDRAEKWRCINCGTENPSSQLFCSNCHLPTRPISPIVVANFP